SYCQLGAARATSVYAYEEAVELLEQALAVQEVLDPTDAVKRCELLLLLGDALLPSHQPLRAAEQVAPEAFVLAEKAKSDRQAFKASLIAILGLRRHGAQVAFTLPVFREWAERAKRFASPGTAEQAWADLSMAQS